ncbi:MAG: MerR family transcriptional regulator [Candidatus Roizmanbacteria bacterium]
MILDEALLRKLHSGQLIVYNPDIEEGIKLLESNKLKHLRDYLSDRKYRVKQLNSNNSYRVVGHWISLGLIEANQEAGHSWCRYSISDLIWLEAIITMRKFGLSLEQIKILKRHLFYSPEDNNKRTQLFNYYLLLAIKQLPIGIIVLEDGCGAMVTEDQLKLSKTKYLFDSPYLYISINRILTKIFPTLTINLLYEVSNLTAEEMRLISLVRQNKFKEIRVTFRDGKPVIFKGISDLDVEIKMFNILKMAKYQEIRLVVDDGRTIKIERTLKEKL